MTRTMARKDAEEPADDWEFSSDWDNDQDVEEWTTCAHFSCPGVARRRKVNIFVKNHDASSVSSLGKSFGLSMKRSRPFQCLPSTRGGLNAKYLDDELHNEDLFKVSSRSGGSSERQRSSPSLAMLPKTQQLSDSTQLYVEQTRPLGLGKTSWKQAEEWGYSGSSSCPSLNYHYQVSRKPSQDKITNSAAQKSNRALLGSMVRSGPTVHENLKEDSTEKRHKVVKALTSSKYPDLQTSGWAHFQKWSIDEDHSSSERTEPSTVVSTPPPKEKKSVISIPLMKSSVESASNEVDPLVYLIETANASDYRRDHAQPEPKGASHTRDTKSKFAARPSVSLGDDYRNARSRGSAAALSPSNVSPQSDMPALSSSKRASGLSRWQHKDGSGASKIPPAFGALAPSAPKPRVQPDDNARTKKGALPLLTITPDGFPSKGPAVKTFFLEQLQPFHHEAPTKVPAWILLKQRKGDDIFRDRRLSSGESVTSTVTDGTKGGDETSLRA